MPQRMQLSPRLLPLLSSERKKTTFPFSFRISEEGTFCRSSKCTWKELTVSGGGFRRVEGGKLSGRREGEEKGKERRRRRGEEGFSVVMKITECCDLVLCKLATVRQLSLDSLCRLSSSFLWGFLGGRLLGGWLCLLYCCLCAGLFGADLLCCRLLCGWLLGLDSLLCRSFGSL